MKKALIGSGGFASEIASYMEYNDITRFVDDDYYDNQKYTLPLSEFDPNKYEVLVAIGNPIDRISIVNRLPKDTTYISFIDKRAFISGCNFSIGEGSVVCPGTILTTNIQIGKHCHLNLLTTIGHDCIIGDYFTTAPGARISGHCIIGNNVYIGTNASIREGITICDNVTIGLNAAVVKDITIPGIYVGVPVKKI